MVMLFIHKLYMCFTSLTPITLTCLPARRRRTRLPLLAPLAFILLLSCSLVFIIVIGHNAQHVDQLVGRVLNVDALALEQLGTAQAQLLFFFVERKGRNIMDI